MPQQSWSKKRERQYEEIKRGQEERGQHPGRAEEVAARTVNKQRARSGESEQRSRTSTEDLSPGERGGRRSGHGPGGRTKQQLYADAKRAGIRGRSRMNKRELQKVLSR